MAKSSPASTRFGNTNAASRTCPGAESNSPYRTGAGSLRLGGARAPSVCPPEIAATRGRAAPAPRAPLLGPCPVLAAAEHQEAALDAQQVGADQMDVPAVGLAVLGVVDLASPAIARGLHRQEDLRAHDGVVALARARIVLVEPRLGGPGDGAAVGPAAGRDAD